MLVSNLANANTTRPAGVEPYRRKDVVFSSVAPSKSFSEEFDSAVQGVEISGIVTDRSEPRKVHEPGHENADSEGYVYYPNLQAVNSAKEMAMKTLEILQ